MKRKSEKKAFLLFTDRCEKLGFQFFTNLKDEYPSVCFWKKGLTEQECREQGCVRVVADVSYLWSSTYQFLKTYNHEPIPTKP